MEQVVANLHGTKWVMHASLVSEAFFASPIGQELCPLPPAAARQLVVALRATDSSMPIIAKTSSVFNVSGSLSELSYRVSRLPHNFLAVQVLLINVSFKLSWANPCWNLFDFDPSTQLNTVAARIKQSLAQVQHTSWFSNVSNSADFEAVKVFKPNVLAEWWFSVKQKYQAIST